MVSIVQSFASLDATSLRRGNKDSGIPSHLLEQMHLIQRHRISTQRYFD
jgi:hypothetical protein